MLMQLATLVGALFLGLVGDRARVSCWGCERSPRSCSSPLIRLQRAIINPKQMRSAGTPGAYAP